MVAQRATDELKLTFESRQRTSITKLEHAQMKVRIKSAVVLDKNCGVCRQAPEILMCLLSACTVHAMSAYIQRGFASALLTFTTLL